MSGGKSAAPQVNGSNGSAPNKSLPTRREQINTVIIKEAHRRGLKHRNVNRFFTYLYLVAMWWVEGVGSRCWLVWAPGVSQGRREPCQKCLSTAASLRYSPPAYKVMVEPPAETCKFTHAQTTQLFFSFSFFFASKQGKKKKKKHKHHTDKGRR